MSMLVTLLGIAIVVRLLHPLNVLLAMLFTLFERLTEVRPVHSQKAFSPMLVTGKFITL